MNEIKFWVVTKPYSQWSTLGDILFEATPIDMMKQALGGLRFEEVLLTTTNYEDARSLADGELLRVADAGG